LQVLPAAAFTLTGVAFVAWQVPSIVLSCADPGMTGGTVAYGVAIFVITVGCGALIRGLVLRDVSRWSRSTRAATLLVVIGIALWVGGLAFDRYFGEHVGDCVMAQDGQGLISS
jgi:predicted MFS family arabinose efflux permease